MLSTILFALLALFNFQLALAGPTTFRKYKANCPALVEEEAWQITNFVAFQADRGEKNCSSYILFTFEDVNSGLEMKTWCNRTLPMGSNATLSSDQYYACQNKTVNFIYENGGLQVERYYEDPCLGEAPYDSAIAYGDAPISATTTNVSNGVFTTNTHVEIPISSMS